MKLKQKLDKFAEKVTSLSGHAYTFVGACALIVLWGVFGPLMHYSDTWQLIINTGTTLITFLMVFLIQNTQNREQEQFKKWIKEDVNRTKEVLRAVNRKRP